MAKLIGVLFLCCIVLFYFWRSSWWLPFSLLVPALASYGNHIHLSSSRHNNLLVTQPTNLPLLLCWNEAPLQSKWPQSSARCSVHSGKVGTEDDPHVQREDEDCWCCWEDDGVRETGHEQCFHDASGFSFLCVKVDDEPRGSIQFLCWK